MNAIREEHISADVLLQDWLGEIDPLLRDAIDGHLMTCDECGNLLDEVVTLGASVRGAVQAGAIALITGPGFLHRLAARGARIREYRPPPNGSVNCSVAPGDEVLVSRLQVQLQGVQRLDISIELSVEPGVLHHVEDIPFDVGAGEVLLFPSVAQVRQLPAHTMHVSLLAREDGESRELAHYEFRHTPWVVGTSDD